MIRPFRPARGGVLAFAIVLCAPGAALAQEAPALNGANTAWLLTATALVLFMTMPGLALFYAGLVRAKNALSVMMQCVAIACLASVLWLALGYSLAFSGDGPLVGDLSKAFLAGVGRDARSGGLPEALFFMFQMTFAIITPALIIGAFVERTKFAAVLMFTALWLALVYAPVCHWVWGGGWLMTRGVMDYAGGIVVHATAGVSALVFAKMVGPRDGYPRELEPPHSPGLVMIGAAMLWVGWYGFNGGSALAADQNAAMAIAATHLSASAAGLTWAAIEWVRFGKPSLMGAVTGVIGGLATVTPASGFIGPAGGLVLGVLAGGVCFAAVSFVKQKLRIDDSLDVFAVHGVGGIMGTVLVAALADQRLGGAGYAVTGSALAQLGVQLAGLAATILWSGAATVAIIWLTRRVVGLRVDDMTLQDGLDLAEHGERETPA